MRQIYKQKFGPGTLLILLVLAALFAFIKITGNEIQNEISTEVKLATKFEKEENYRKAEEHLTKAENKFGIIYSIHVGTMSDGDDYFPENRIKGKKGFIQLLQIAQDMCDGETDIEKRLEQAAKNLEHIKNEPRDSSFNELYKLGLKSLDALKAVIPLVKLCNSSNFTQAKEELNKFMANKDYLEANAILVALSMYYKIAEETKSRQDVHEVVWMTSSFAEGSTADVPQKLADKAINLQKKLFPDEAASDSTVQEEDSEELSITEKYELALTLAKMGELEEAKNLLELCNKEKPENNTICYLLAVVYNKLGLEHKTELLCKEILKRDPEHEKAKNLLNRVSF